MQLAIQWDRQAMIAGSSGKMKASFGSGLTIALKDNKLRGFAKVMRDQTDMKQAVEEVTWINKELHATIRTLDGTQTPLQDKVRDLEEFEVAVVGRELGDD